MVQDTDPKSWFLGEFSEESIQSSEDEVESGSDQLLGPVRGRENVGHIPENTNISLSSDLLSFIKVT